MFRETAVFIWGLIAIILALLFQIIPFINACVKGVYSWHITRPSLIHGALELGVVFAVMALSARSRKLFMFIWIAVALIYLQLHHVLVPALSALIYFEGLTLIGYGTLKGFKLSSTDNNAKHLESFLSGILVWGAAAIALSGFGMGTITELRLLTFFLILLSLPVFRLRQTFTGIWLLSLRNTGTNERIGFSFLSISLLAQYSKSNNIPDFDSLWYGLRSEYVLFGTNSFYDNLGLVHPVYYYPKFSELILSPLAGLNDYSFVMSGNIILFGILLLIVYQMGQLAGLRDHALIATCAIASIPAIANMASTAKPDIGSCVLMLAGTYFLFQWVSCRIINALVMTFSTLSISLAVKLTSLFYIPLLVAGYVLLELVLHFKSEKHPTALTCSASAGMRGRFCANNLFLPACAFFIVCGTWIRTFWITGYPTLITPLATLWESMGFELKFPFNLQSVTWRLQQSNGLLDYDFPQIIQKWSFLFFGGGKGVDGQDHWFMVWPGNLPIFLGIIGGVAYVTLSALRKSNEYRLLLLVLPTGIGSLYLCTMYKDGGDGNYFIYPVAAIILGLIGLFSRATIDIKFILKLALLIFIPFQTIFMLMTHFSWKVGTGEFSGSLTESFIDSPAESERILREAGLWEIEQYFRSQRHVKRVIGYGAQDLRHLAVPYRLSCRYERFVEMFNTKIFESSESFARYLQWAKIDYIILLKNEMLPSRFGAARDFLRDRNDWIVLENRNYLMYDVSRIRL